MNSHQLSTALLPDGRTITYAGYGAPLNSSLHPAIFYFHGFPSSRLEGALWHQDAEKLGIHLIAVDRPGMGYSTFQTNRTLLDWPNDIIALADQLHIREFGVLGSSGGGPYVLACLSALPNDRLKIGAALCGVYPLSLGARRMLWASWSLLKGAQWAPGIVGALIDWKVGITARDSAHPDRFHKAMTAHLQGEGLPEVDKNFLKGMAEDPVAGSAFVEAVRESLRESSRGAVCEARILGGDWGFPLTKVDGSRLIMWHGTLDANSPIEMADKAAETIQPRSYRRLEGEGHPSLGYGHKEEVLRSMLSEMEILPEG
ncbi:alpha/beta-hydrolase [Thozetella sp. PMI_491]|nr:alpha/beta-hydrolase [Thozetella sp. PMI_491]